MIMGVIEFIVLWGLIFLACLAVAVVIVHIPFLIALALVGIPFVIHESFVFLRTVFRRWLRWKPASR